MNIAFSLTTGGPLIPVFYITIFGKINNKICKAYKIDWLFFRIRIYNRYKYYET